MIDSRHIRTPFFAAAIYACACLLVYGCAVEAHARAATKKAAEARPQHAAVKRTLSEALSSLRDFPTIRQSEPRPSLYRAMLSAALVARPRVEEKFQDQNNAPVALERRAAEDSFIPAETFRALLSRRLAAL